MSASKIRKNNWQFHVSGSYLHKLSAESNIIFYFIPEIYLFLVLCERIRTMTSYFTIYGADITFICYKSAPFSPFLKKMVQKGRGRS